MANTSRALRDHQVVAYCRNALKAAGVPYPPPMPMSVDWEYAQAAGQALDTVFVSADPRQNAWLPFSKQTVRLRTPEGSDRELAFAISESCEFSMRPQISISDGYKGDSRVDLNATGTYVFAAAPGQTLSIHEIGVYLELWLGWWRNKYLHGAHAVERRVQAVRDGEGLVAAYPMAINGHNITTLSEAGLGKLLDAYLEDAPVLGNGVRWAQESKQAAITAEYVRTRLTTPVQRTIIALVRYSSIWMSSSMNRIGIKVAISSAADVPSSAGV